MLSMGGGGSNSLGLCPLDAEGYVYICIIGQLSLPFLMICNTLYSTAKTARRRRACASAARAGW